MGSIQYPAAITRPDIAKAASLLAEFSKGPAIEHQRAADQVLRYLADTKRLSICFDGNHRPVFEAFSDASLGDDTRTRKSSQGFVIKLFGGAIDWQATRQKTVSTSSTEAEFKALAEAAKELIRWKRVFKATKLEIDEEFSIWCDNQQTIRLLTAETPKLVTKLRYVDIHHHWLREQVQNGEIEVSYVKSSDMAADGLTKALPRQKQEAFVRQLGIEVIHTTEASS